MSSLTILATAIGLGTAAGINAWATLLVYGLLSRFYPSMFQGELPAFFAATPVLVTLGVLYLIEFVADKIPGLDHVWDLVQTLVRPLAGGVVAFASAREDVPPSILVLAAVIGGGAALTSHLGKMSVRGASTATTGGVGNPLLSLGEDLFAFAQATLAIFLPWIVLSMMAVVLLLVGLWVMRRRRRGVRVDRP
jgi:hypothetical protein